MAWNPGHMSEAGTEWSGAETASLVDAYVWMWLNDRAGRKITKAHLVRQLQRGPLTGRSKQSIEFKLRNVSAIFQEQKMPFVVGYVPATNASDDLKEAVSSCFGRLGSMLEGASPRMWG